MRRRDFLKLSSAAAVASGLFSRFGEPRAEAGQTAPTDAHAFYVSPQGDDGHPGTAAQPLATIAAAQRAVRKAMRNGSPIRVWLQEGTYYLESPLTFSAQDSGVPDAPILYAAGPRQEVTISGGRPLSCRWMPYRDGIMRTVVPAGIDFSQLFVNGRRQIRARYPNYDPSQPGKSGYLQAAGPIPADSTSPYSDPDEEMHLLRPGATRYSLRSGDIFKQAVEKARRRGNPYFSGSLLGQSSMESANCRPPNKLDLVCGRWAAGWG